MSNEDYRPDEQVVIDDAPVEDPIDATTADSEAQLQRDDNEAIDKSNIIGDRTRHAKPDGGYQEPSEDDLPQE